MTDVEAGHLLGPCSWWQWQHHPLKLSARSVHPQEAGCRRDLTEAVTIIPKASRKEIPTGKLPESVLASWKQRAGRKTLTLISIVTRTACLLSGFSVGFETVKDWHAGSGRREKRPNFRVDYFSFHRKNM